MAFTTIERIEREPTTSSVKPSVDKGSFWPTFSMDQELTPFGAWRSDPIWVPRKTPARNSPNRC